MAWSAWLCATTALGAKVLRYSENDSPTTLDPVQSGSMYGFLVITGLYDTLYEYKYLKVPYELKPGLAESMPEISKDQLVYTIRLKKGVHFIDDPAFPDGKGREVVAEDFVFSIKRNFDPKERSQGEWLWQGHIVGLDEWKAAGCDYAKPVEGLKALDSHTLQIKLTKPYPQFLYTLPMAYAAVTPREAVLKYGKEISVHPVGSGPFKLVSFSPQKVVMERNPKFRKEIFDPDFEGYEEAVHGYTGIKELKGKTLPIVDRVEIDFMKQSIARWNSFTKGDEIQYAGIPQELVDRVLSSKDPPALAPEYAAKYKLRASPEFGLVYFGFNMSNRDFGYDPDPKVNEANRALRCAIRSGFNWRQRIERFYYGIGKPFAGMIPPFMSGYSDLGDQSIKFDPEYGKKLLKDNGWTKDNLPTFIYSAVSSVQNKQFFEQTRGFLKAIGYPTHKIKLKQFATFGDYARALKNNEVQTLALGWAIDYPDAENLMQLLYGPNESPGSNSTNYKNPKYDELYERASVMPDSPVRTELYRQASQIMIDDCVMISGFSRVELLVWHKNAIIYPSRAPQGNLFKYFDVKE